MEASEQVYPWHWRSLPLQHRSGATVFAQLFQHDPIAVLLESPTPEQAPSTTLNRYSICAGSPRMIAGTPRQWTPPLGQILPTLDQIRTQQSSWLIPDTIPDLPFIGGSLGWLGYDLAWEIEQLPYLRADNLPFPPAFWYEPQAFAILDHHEQQLWLAATSIEVLDKLETQLPPEKTDPFTALQSQLCSELVIDVDQQLFEARIRRAKAHIQAGDVFQANLSLRFHVEAELHPWALYQTLHQINPSPFASYWQTPWGCVVSCSPERLVQLTGERAQTRPIAGTRPRGHSSTEEEAYRQTLLNHPKERAEHTMLVDLERNDLGRVCTWGTVQVDEFFTIERYSHVMHLVSNVVGQLQPDRTAIDLIRAMFPGGTITGCPKVRCMEIIETLESDRRNLFYGSCGYLDCRGSLDLNILIRTLLVTATSTPSLPWHQPFAHPVTVWGQVGAGIVADSDPEQEWLESLQKAKAQWVAIQILTNGSNKPNNESEHFRLQ
jgi:para-aminobenzoate synthetase component I